MGVKRVWAVCEDGRRFEGDLLIGADGIWSKVRDRKGLCTAAVSTAVGFDTFLLHASHMFDVHASRWSHHLW